TREDRRGAGNSLAHVAAERENAFARTDFDALAAALTGLAENVLGHRAGRAQPDAHGGRRRFFLLVAPQNSEQLAPAHITGHELRFGWLGRPAGRPPRACWPNCARCRRGPPDPRR